MLHISYISINLEEIRKRTLSPFPWKYLPLYPVFIFKGTFSLLQEKQQCEMLIVPALKSGQNIEG